MRREKERNEPVLEYNLLPRSLVLLLLLFRLHIRRNRRRLLFVVVGKPVECVVVVNREELRFRVGFLPLRWWRFVSQGGCRIALGKTALEHCELKRGVSRLRRPEKGGETRTALEVLASERKKVLVPEYLTSRAGFKVAGEDEGDVGGAREFVVGGEGVEKGLRDGADCGWERWDGEVRLEGDGAADDHCILTAWRR